MEVSDIPAEAPAVAQILLANPSRSVDDVSMTLFASRWPVRAHRVKVAILWLRKSGLLVDDYSNQRPHRRQHLYRLNHDGIQWARKHATPAAIAPCGASPPPA